MSRSDLVSSSEILDMIYDEQLEGSFLAWAGEKLKCTFTWDEGYGQYIMQRRTT